MNLFVRFWNRNVVQNVWDHCCRVNGFVNVSCKWFFFSFDFRLKNQSGIFCFPTAIQEACADIVASSEMLTATFDCDIYPSSNDENECKDITRGTNCLKNEFQCNDQTCIPSQWQYVSCSISFFFTSMKQQCVLFSSVDVTT